MPAHGEDPSYPGTSDHTLFWYFCMISIEIAMLAGLVVVTHLTVTKGSGLNDPEKVRRIWGRAPEIRFQPVLRPLLFALGVGYGSQTVVHSVLGSFFALIGVGFRHHVINALLGLISFSAASWLCMVIYRATGGSLLAVCAVSIVLLDWFMSGVLLDLAFGFYKMLNFSSSFVGFLVFAVIHLLVQAVFQVPFLIWGQYAKLPATARLIYNSSIVPGWVKLDRTIVVASGPLAFIYFIAYVCEYRLTTQSYLGNLTLALATFMILAAAALAAIISVNRALLASEFQWQWRAFLTPAIPLGVIKFISSFISLVTGNTGFFYAIWSVIHFTASCGSCGVLGAYVYMMLAERYAKAHFDEDELAQDDLLGEFDDDEDNEELDV